MKNQQRREAQSLYLNSGLTKTQIADQLSVSRRTVYQWSLDGDWDKLRKSAQHMPAILAEKCYYLIGHFADHLLSAESQEVPIGKRDVDMLHKLTITANKLKQRSTVSEAMQTFTLLLARMQIHDPALAELVAPHIQSFVHDRRKLSETEFLLSGFNEEGYLDHKEEDPTEQVLDKQDLAVLMEELHKAHPGDARQQPQRKPGSELAPTATPAPTLKTAITLPQPKQSFRDRNKSLYSRAHSPAVPQQHERKTGSF